MAVYLLLLFFFIIVLLADKLRLKMITNKPTLGIRTNAELVGVY